MSTANRGSYLSNQSSRSHLEGDDHGLSRRRHSRAPAVTARTRAGCDVRHRGGWQQRGVVAAVGQRVQLRAVRLVAVRREVTAVALEDVVQGGDGVLRVVQAVRHTYVQASIPTVVS